MKTKTVFLEFIRIPEIQINTMEFMIGTLKTDVILKIIRYRT